MKLIRKISDLNKAIKDNNKLGFVPTMGGLHDGHQSLIRKSKKKCKKTIVSIFVNPKQFNVINDYKSYPRNLSKDLKILKKLNVEYVFIPKVNQVYKKEKIKKFQLTKSQKILCAKYRKGHFEGVLNVMNRFMKMILPKYVFMGEKDFQQLFLIKKFLEPIYSTKIISCKTIRDKNKIALSTRNNLIDKKDIHILSYISKKMFKLKSKINLNKNKSNYLIKNFKDSLVKKYNIKVEYLEARNVVDLKKNILSKKYKLFIAYYIKKVRLVDNF